MIREYNFSRSNEGWVTTYPRYLGIWAGLRGWRSELDETNGFSQLEITNGIPPMRIIGARFMGIGPCGGDTGGFTVGYALHEIGGNWWGPYERGLTILNDYFDTVLSYPSNEQICDRVRLKITIYSPSWGYSYRVQNQAYLQYACLYGGE